MSYNRSLARTVAHVNMKKHGYTQLNRPRANGSLFSNMWRGMWGDYVKSERRAA